MLTSIITTPPLIHPVTAVELAAHCHIIIQGPAEIELTTTLDSLCAAATMAMENYLWRALITQTRMAYAPGTQSWYELPRVPLQTLESFTLQTEAGAALPQATTGFLVDTVNGTIHTKSTTVFPSVTLRELNPIEISYKCGYGVTAETVPAPIRQCILMLAATLYRNRENEYEAVQLPRIMETYRNILSDYRRL